MSKISQIFDAVRAACSAALPLYDELSNAYIPQENANKLFNKAYGVAYGPGLNESRLTKPKFTPNRQIDVLLINKVTASESNVNFLVEQQKAIQEDLFAIINQVEQDGAIYDLCTKFEYSSDTGIEFLDAAEAKYYLLSATFNFSYDEIIS